MSMLGLGLEVGVEGKRGGIRCFGCMYPPTHIRVDPTLACLCGKKKYERERNMKSKRNLYVSVSGRMHASETPYIFPWVKGKLQINLE